MKRLLFLAMHRPGRSPSQRFRFEQYLEYLRAHGFECVQSHLLSAADDRVFYSPGGFVGKLRVTCAAAATRTRDILRLRHFDAVLVQREAFFLGPAIVEWALTRRGRRLVFDFDDSVWMRHVSRSNRGWGWLKRPQKTASIVRWADLVLAGNSYLADYALPFNTRVEILPTTIDTDAYRPRRSARPAGAPVRLGWSGSTTTIENFKHCLPALARLRDRFGSQLEFRVIGDASFSVPDVGIQGKPWQLEREVDEISSFDIGLMPLPDNPWERGKCGLKALQYMALEVPTVVSPVGVNTEIVESGVNGIVARTTEEWVAALTSLIESIELRRRLGKAGRQTVVKSYSFDSQKDRYLGFFEALCGSPP